MKVAFRLQKGIIFLKVCSIFLELDQVFPPHQKYPLHEHNCVLEFSSSIMTAQRTIVTPPRDALLEVGRGKMLGFYCVKWGAGWRSG
jgi:hypothetical protein